jgi:hypothetical protein
MESLEIRRAKNGFVVIVNTTDASDEYIFDSYRKVLKFIKEYLDSNSN